MYITFTALMVLENEILVSYSSLVLVHQCCLEPLLDLWLTNSENFFLLKFKSVLLEENYVRLLISLCALDSGVERGHVLHTA